MTEQRTDYDSPWKEVIEAYFPSFLEFFFPPAYNLICGARLGLGERLLPVQLFTVMASGMHQSQCGFKEVVKSYEEADRMLYVTSIERLAIEEGIQEGILETNRRHIIQFLQTRFGEVPSSIADVINGISDSAVLQSLFTRAIAINSLAEFQQVLDEVVPGE